ncbi:MAG: hypothetical protein C0601_07555 [Candidatus Muiribacterium halophilum]|uniref:DUF6754 domain-containing protein n=1 Tax=Muiribacterium halophilum TaxID=2053465 RepID=A0A2N5ZFE4_MUIH1|nr:MAG: hypothetical protein C0601_07555 [Candidatus Muirbacterium halophilum]
MKKIFSIVAMILLLGVSAFAEAEKSTKLLETSRFPVLIGLILFAFVIIYYIQKAKSGQHIFIRRIAGLNAIDDALGRATEMGKPVLYVPGIGGISELQTLASISILGHIAKKTASYETDLYVPLRDPMVYSTATEVVRESYLGAGRPDAFRENMVEFLTSDQFGYVAGVDGYMVRENPAANFYLGSFWAESLILAETGNSVGSIQIAGTANPSQLPFFIASCDYTLIGEELYAAGAYLSTDPKSKGSLKGQDMGKLAVMIVIIVFALLNVVRNATGMESLSNMLNWLDKFFAMKG